MAGEEYGFVPVSRRFYETDPFWREEREFSRAEAWLDLIARAAWAPHVRVIGGVEVPLMRGQLPPSSARYLADAWKWSRARVRRFLELLIEMERITIDLAHPAAHLGALITLTNYETYNPAPESLRPTSRPTPGERVKAPAHLAAQEPAHFPAHPEPAGSGAVARSPATDGGASGPPSGPSSGPPSGHKDNKRVKNKEERTNVVAGGSAANSPHEREEAAGGPPAEEVRAGVIGAMRKLVEIAAGQIEDTAARGRLEGELELIVEGDDLAVWRDSAGSQVPWDDRPRLLRLALRRWYIDRERYPNPRSSLLYVIGQQYGPRRSSSMSATEERDHYEKHRVGAARRPEGNLQNVMGIEGSKPKEPAAEELGAQEWAKSHPGEYKEIIKAIAKREDLDTTNTIERIKATALAIQHVNEEILCQKAN